MSCRRPYRDGMESLREWKARLSLVAEVDPGATVEIDRDTCELAGVTS
jgi:hypothetical protein